MAPLTRRLTAAGAAMVVVALVQSGLRGGQQGGAPATGAISGVVVDGRTGEPVGDAIVSLAADGSFFSGPLRRQQTDARGRFVFPELEAGVTYLLGAERAGYLPGDEERPGRPSQSVRRIALARGQWVRDTRIALWPPASISGVVFDEYGDPVVGAYVRALLRTGGTSHTGLAAGPVATTDDLGRYRIPNLPPGDYLVAVPVVQESVSADASQGGLNGLTPEAAARRAAPPPIPGTRAGDDSTLLLAGRYALAGPGAGSRNATYPGAYFAGARTAAEATPVTLDHGIHRDGIDFRLQPVPAWRVTGLVRAAAGDVESLASIVLRLIPTGSEMTGIGGEAATARPGPDGRFTFLSVPSGDYLLQAAPGEAELIMASTATLAGATGARLPATRTTMIPVVAPGVSLSLATTSSDHPLVWGRAALTLGDHDLDGIELELVPTASIHGSLVLETESAADPPAHRSAALILEPSLANSPLTAPTFRVEETRDDRPWSAPRRFDAWGLTPGRYHLRTNSTSALVKSVTWNARDITNLAFDIATGDRVSDVIITMTTRIPTLSGTVRDVGGTLAPGAVVVCFPVDPAEWPSLGPAPPRMRYAFTNSEGRYLVDAIPAGDYFVVAVPADHRVSWRNPEFLAAASRIAARARVEWGVAATQDLRLEVVNVR